MRPSKALEGHREEIQRIVEANHGKNPRIFGSVAAGTDTEESDLDILIDSGEHMTFIDMAEMEFQISELIGVKLDIHTPDSLHERFRQDVLKKAVRLCKIT